MRPQVTAALSRAVSADHLSGVLARYRIGTVVDVGAHVGEYATFLRGLGYDGAIVSYEPVREAFERLAAASAADDLWTAHRLALGDEDGPATINVAHSSDFSSLRAVSDYGAAEFPTRSRVERGEAAEMRRLDGLFADHVRGEAPVMLKLDTQGWDLQALEGATGILDHVAVVQTEAALQPIYDGVPALGEVLSALGSRGFAPSAFLPVSRDEDLRLIEVDVVAVRSRS